MDRLEQLTRTLKDRFPGLELREHEPMSRHTTFRIGGPARLMALPRSAGEARGAVRTAAELGMAPSSWATAATCWWLTGATRALS